MADREPEVWCQRIAIPREMLEMRGGDKIELDYDPRTHTYMFSIYMYGTKTRFLQAFRLFTWRLQDALRRAEEQLRDR